jgi:hypothetical protein
MNAAIMLLVRHERGIHVVSEGGPGPDEQGRAGGWYPARSGTKSYGPVLRRGGYPRTGPSANGLA